MQPIAPMVDIDLRDGDADKKKEEDKALQRAKKLSLLNERRRVRWALLFLALFLFVWQFQQQQEQFQATNALFDDVTKGSGGLGATVQKMWKTTLSTLGQASSTKDGDDGSQQETRSYNHYDDNDDDEYPKSSSSKREKVKILLQPSNAELADKCGAHLLTSSKQEIMSSVKGLRWNKKSHIFTMPQHNINQNQDNNNKHIRNHLCVPQKNGNRQFMALRYAAYTGEAPHNITQVMNAKLTSSNEHYRPVLDEDDESEDGIHDDDKTLERILFVARNPYSRLLSLYLQKVKGACISGSLGCEKLKFYGMKQGTTFAKFVSRLYKELTDNGKTMCQMNAHLCLQVENCVAPIMDTQQVLVLKLEQQAQWFPCLVNDLGIVKEEALRGPGWTIFNNNTDKSCYYTPTGQCEDMMSGAKARRLEDAANSNGQQEKEHQQTGSVHATGASNQLYEYYTPSLARMVSHMYATDFRALSYPVWDGVSPIRHEH